MMPNQPIGMRSPLRRNASAVMAASAPRTTHSIGAMASRLEVRKLIALIEGRGLLLDPAFRSYGLIGSCGPLTGLDHT
jgi:hypothetical protein